MSISKEQVKHDRINLGRLVKSLENTISEGSWMEADQHEGEEAWAKAQGMAQKIKYARQLLLNVDYYQELDLQTSSPTSQQQKFLQNMRETLDRLDSVVDVVQKRLAPELDAQISYLKLVPVSIVPEEEHTSVLRQEHAYSEGELPETVRSEGRRSSPVPDPAQHLIPSSSLPVSESTRASTRPHTPATSALLSASLQTHEELSNELSRMATQLKRNALHFSESLDKDKSLVESASEALEKNYDSVTKERVRLKDHTGKSSGTTWMIFGALIAVSVAWVFMLVIIRLT